MDQPDEMHAVVVETSPPRPSSESFEVELAIVKKHIVLARHIVNLIRFRALHDLRGRVELLGRGKMRDIARVNHKRRPLVERVDLVDRLLKSLRHIGIRSCMKSDVAVADLNKAEAGLSLRCCEQLRAQYAAIHCPDESGACPRHTFEKTASLNLILFHFVSP